MTLATDFDVLKDAILGQKQGQKQLPEASLSPNDLSKEDLNEQESENRRIEEKRSSFRKGEESWDIPEDAEIEINADKGKIKLKLQDLKDRAAGDIAVKNRMNALAEERKKVQSTLKQFAKMSKDDPLAALEYISNQVKEAESDFSYDLYLKSLADQAERLAKMSDPDRKAYQAEKKAKDLEDKLQDSEKQAYAQGRVQDLAAKYNVTYTRLTDLADQIISNEEIVKTLESEEDLFHTMEDILVDAQAQRAASELISSVDKSLSNREDLVFEVSELMQDHPDFSKDDLKQIIRDANSLVRKKGAEERLSNKARIASPQVTYEGGSDFDILKAKLLEEKESKGSRR